MITKGDCLVTWPHELTISVCSFFFEAALVVEAQKENLVPWYERTDFDLPSEEEEDEKERLVKGRRKGSKKTPKKENPDHYEYGFTYPLDVWCLLAQYIRPEQVQNFALICKGARDATNMRTFWLRIYKRHISQPMKLPERLQPHRIDCRPGLRARIIRALYHGYGLFRSRLLSNTCIVTDPSELESQLCISMWYKQVMCKKQTRKVWVFYFKFSRKYRGGKRKPGYMSLSSNWLDQVDDVRHNPEEHNCILQVNCVNFLPVSPIQGHVLTRASVGVSRDMKHSTVKLTFHSPRTDGRYRKEEGTIVVLDPAYDLKVINWWSPSYPHHKYEL